MKDSFEIIPAVDILNGKCVRLTQGMYNQVEEFSSDPASVAKRWEEEGASRIHVVDLDGARKGITENKETILKLIKATKAKVQVGGGIRSIESAKEYFDGGASYVILGTKAFEDRLFLNKALKTFNEKIILGLDLKKNKIGLSGWKETIEIDFNKLSSELADIKQIIYTDISKDGTLSGPNIESIEKVASSFSSKIIVSGGIKNLEDIISILKIRMKGHKNIVGVILGKSLYKGTISLSAAIKLAKDSSK